MKSLRLMSYIMPLSLLFSLPAAGVTEVKTQDELSSALKGQKKAAIKVHADWCGACKISAKPFSNAAAKHPEVKALSLDADNKEHRKFIKTFQIEGLPSTIYIKKIDASDPEYNELAKLLGIEGKSTIVITRKEVGSRGEDEFNKTFESLGGAKQPEKASVEKKVESAQEEKPAKLLKKKRGYRLRRKAKGYDAQEMANMGFPMESDAYTV